MQANKRNVQLGKMLVDAGIISQENLEKALLKQSEDGGSLGTNLIKSGFVDEKTLTEFLGKQYNLEAVDLSNYDFDTNVLKIIPANIVTKYTVLPIRKRGNIITLAMANPRNIFAIDDIKFTTGCEVNPVVAAETLIRKAIDDYYGNSSDVLLENVLKDIEDGDVELVEGSTEDEAAEFQAAEDAPVVKLVNSIISDAVNKHASDIHIEPYEKSFRVRFRIDGVLYEVMEPPLRMRGAITSRIKIMAELDIAERRLPQDGRIKIRLKSKTIDLRVSTLPTLFGEKIVMRILDKGNLMLDLTMLGLEEEEHEKLKRAILAPNGIVLVTGPTGSGKTTTLYSCLNLVNTPENNIMTAEDPVEYNMRGINQVQMKSEIGLTFSAALRSFLRQDPDTILVGETRDKETAEIAIKAALTGHLVLSTLHTNDAPSTISRLIDMGIEPFMVSSSVIFILAQRLVRKICTECKTEMEIPPEILKSFNISQEEADAITFYKGAGCHNCSETGYRGRLAIYEMMELTDPIKDLILKNPPANEIKALARKEGMNTLRDSAIIKFKNGITTYEEVIRVSVAD